MTPRLVRLLRWVVIAVLASGSLIVPRAHAGLYRVNSCWSAFDTRNASWYAIGQSAHTRLVASCPAVDGNPYYTGLGGRTSDGSSSYTPPGGGTWVEFDAPPGTSLFAVTFGVAEIDNARGNGGCWSTGIWAWNGGDFYAAPLLFGQAPCTSTGSSAWSPGHAVGLGGYTRVRAGIQCTSSQSCWADWQGGHGVVANFRDIDVYVDDPQPPGFSANSGNLWNDGWHRGTEQAWASYWDNTGIQYIRGYMDGARFNEQNFNDAGWAPYGIQCYHIYAIPCHNIPNGGLTYDTTQLADGPHTFRAEAVDTGDNPTDYDHVIYVDNHAPAPPVHIDVAGGQGWHTANGFEVTWTNPGQGQGSPIGTARYTLCRAGNPTDCRNGSQSGRGIARLSGLTAPEQGDWVLRVWLEDEAGNADPGSLSDAVHLRFDPQVDAAAFEPLDPADPCRVSVLVADRVSGIAGGAIELRRSGTEPWRTLPTRFAEGRLLATVPDIELEDGAYELRARVRDVAGNERTADRLVDGRAAAISLPLRTATRVTAPGRLWLAFGRRATIRGAVETYLGRPLAFVPIAVGVQPRAGGDLRTVGALRADGDGRFAYAVPPGPSRTLRLAYGGNETLKPAFAELRVLVPAASTISVNRRRVLNGQRVRFDGRLLGGPMPAGGKLVILQAFYRRAWRTFAVTRASASGRWRQPYRFQATTGRVTYRFRARIEPEPGYPYEFGISPVVAVVVRGR